MPNEPSMEEILSSIKRIIADEDRATPHAPRRAASTGESRIVAVNGEDDGHILELTEALRDDSPESQEPDSQEKASAMPATPSSPSKSTSTNARPSRGESRPRASRQATPESRENESAEDAAPVLSDFTARAARDSLQNLSRLLVRDEDGQSNTLEALVREMLRPMLKDWLDANLPDLVETMVKREIDRIAGRV